jgi:ribose/xylose/arabinose/galactoside ABC-type transport system permease subunit
MSVARPAELQSEGKVKSDVRRHSGIGILNNLIRRAGFLPLLVILLLLAGCFVSNFFTIKNIMNVLRQTSYLAIITIGEMLVFIVGGFDLSIGSLVALTSVVTALITASHFTGSEATLTIVGATAGVLVAGFMGLVNGAAVAFFRVAPFIVTLATMGIAAGLALYFSGGTPVWGIPNFMVNIFGSGNIGGVPSVFIIMVIVSIAMYILLNQTHLGRYFWAIGGNENAAILSGLNTKKYTIVAYVLCGLFAGFTGILLTARVGAGEPVLGTGLMLQAMAAAVMGGTKVGGGEGNVPGVVLGAFFITLVGNVMNLANIGSYTQMIVMGAILMFAIITDEIIRK